MQYVLFGGGPLTIMGGVEGLAFVNTKYANASDDFPDIEFHFASGSTHSDGGDQIKKAHGLTDIFYDKVFKPIEKMDAWSVIPMLLRPKSRGKHINNIFVQIYPWKLVKLLKEISTL